MTPKECPFSPAQRKMALVAFQRMAISPAIGYLSLACAAIQVARNKPEAAKKLEPKVKEAWPAVRAAMIRYINYLSELWGIERPWQFLFVNGEEGFKKLLSYPDPRYGTEHVPQDARPTVCPLTLEQQEKVLCEFNQMRISVDNLMVLPQSWFDLLILNNERAKEAKIPDGDEFLLRMQIPIVRFAQELSEVCGIEKPWQHLQIGDEKKFKSFLERSQRSEDARKGHSE
jgi:hypothetical protein